MTIGTILSGVIAAVLTISSLAVRTPALSRPSVRSGGCEGCAPHIFQLPGNGISVQFNNFSINGDCHTITDEEGTTGCMTEECHSDGSLTFTNNTGGTVYVKQSRGNCAGGATVVGNGNQVTVSCEDDEMTCGVSRIIYFSSTDPGGTNCTGVEVTRMRFGCDPCVGE